MKKIILFSIISLASVLLVSCDPHPSDEIGYNNNIVVTVNAQILNYKDTFNLGDTIKLYIEIPDSIVFKNKMTKVDVTSSDVAQFYSHLGYPDTSTGYQGGYGGVSNQLQQSVGIGTLESFGKVVMANVNGKFKALYYIIPQRKGVFFMDEIDFGELAFNNTSNRTQFHFDLGDIDRHFEYILDNLKPSQAANMSIYLSQRGKNQAHELFAFCVK